MLPNKKTKPEDETQPATNVEKPDVSVPAAPVSESTAPVTRRSPKIALTTLTIPPTSEPDPKDLLSGKSPLSSPPSAAEKKKIAPSDNSTDMGMLYHEDNSIQEQMMERMIIQKLACINVKKSKRYKIALRAHATAEESLALLIKYVDLKNKLARDGVLDATELKEFNVIKKEFTDLRIHMMDNQLTTTNQFLHHKEKPEGYTCLRGVIHSGLLQGILGEDAKTLSTLCVKVKLEEYTPEKITALQKTMRDSLSICLKDAFEIEKENIDNLINDLVLAVKELGTANAFPIISSDKNGWSSEPELQVIANITEKINGGFIISGAGKSGNTTAKEIAAKANAHGRRKNSRLQGFKVSPAATQPLIRLAPEPFPSTKKSASTPASAITPGSTTDDRLSIFSTQPKTDGLSPLPLDRTTSTDSTTSDLGLASPTALASPTTSTVDAKEESPPSTIPGTPLGRFISEGDESSSESDSSPKEKEQEKARASLTGLYGKKISVASSPTTTDTPAEGVKPPTQTKTG